MRLMEAPCPAQEITVRRRKWTSAEDESLQRAVMRHGADSKSSFAWAKIKGEVGGHRSIRDCKKRWFYTLDPGLKKGRWSAEEDAILRQGYAEFGSQWHKIAPLITGRTDEQIAKRWRDVLSPDLRLEQPWTEEEDALLHSLYALYGSRWTPMSDHFPGRNGIACRNRFRSLKSKSSPFSSAQHLLADGGVAGPSSLQGHGTDPAAHPDYDGNLAEPVNSLALFEAAQPDSWGGSELDSAGMFAEHSSWEWPWDEADSAQVPASTSATSATPFAEWFQNKILQEDFPTPASQPSGTALSTGRSDASVDGWDPGLMERSGVSQSQKATVSEPIRDVWGLCVALEGAGDRLTLSTDLIRQLIKDAAGARSMT